VRLGGCCNSRLFLCYLEHELQNTEAASCNYSNKGVTPDPSKDLCNSRRFLNWEKLSHGPGPQTQSWTPINQESMYWNMELKKKSKWNIWFSFSPQDCYTLTIMKQGQQIGSPGLHTLYEGHAIKEALWLCVLYHVCVLKCVYILKDLIC